MSVRKNILANYLGQGWAALMGLAFVPVYVGYLGMESYGLIGVFASLHAWLALLDMGFSPTLNREMARFQAGANTPSGIRDLLRSFEIIYALLATLLVAGIWAAAPWLASHWLNPEKLAAETVRDALVLTGFVVAIRMVEGLYRGALQGLQRQVWLNGAGAILTTIRWGGAAAVLAWIAPTIEAFFQWQAAASLLTTGVFAAKVYGSLPAAGRRATFSGEALRSVWRFSSGMAGIAFLKLFLTQIDKVLLSKMLSLEHFGLYALATLIGTAFAQMIAPLASAIFPRLTELVARRDDAKVLATYHRACQLMSVLVIPPALTFVFYAGPAIELWVRDPVIAAAVVPIAIPLVIGMLLNSFLNIPYMLQLAHGWTSLAIKVNAVAAVIVVPALIYATSRAGAVGAAYVWVLLNAGYLFIGVHFMHRQLIPGEKWRWYLEDIGAPLAAAATLGSALWLIIPQPGAHWHLGIWLVVVCGLMWLTAGLGASALRPDLLRLLRN